VDAAPDAVLEVVVCRGCCCGSLRKHPGADHRAQVEALAAGLAAIPGSRLRLTGCLDLCRNSNVIGVSDGRSGQRSVAWFGGMLLRSDTEALVRFLTAGGALPLELHRRRLAPVRPFPAR
jgi:hypothetical protein